MEVSWMKGWKRGNQGKTEEADKELDEEGERRVIESSSMERRRERIWRKGASLGIAYNAKHILNTTQTHHQIEHSGKSRREEKSVQLKSLCTLLILQCDWVLVLIEYAEISFVKIHIFFFFSFFCAAWAQIPFSGAIIITASSLSNSFSSILSETTCPGGSGGVHSPTFFSCGASSLSRCSDKNTVCAFSHWPSNWTHRNTPPFWENMIIFLRELHEEIEINLIFVFSTKTGSWTSA